MCHLPNVCNRPSCWQPRLIEKLAQARSAVASAKQNRSGFFPSSNVLPSRKGEGKGSSKENRTSSVAGVIISGDSVLNDSPKDLAKDVKMDLARSTWEPHGVLILNCLRQLCFKLMLYSTVVRQKQLVV